jgi:hypothetical protein
VGQTEEPVAQAGEPAAQAEEPAATGGRKSRRRRRGGGETELWTMDVQCAHCDTVATSCRGVGSGPSDCLRAQGWIKAKSGSNWSCIKPVCRGDRQPQPQPQDKKDVCEHTRLRHFL